MIKKILIAAGAALVILIAVIALRPGAFHIARSAVIAAPAPVVFAQVNDFQRWRAWSPWEELDPNLQRTYSGAASGAGAVYAWSGNMEVGEGRMVLTESRTNELIRIRLEFLKPMAAINLTEFAFSEKDGQTTVTWNLAGTNNFVSKALGLMVDMDTMLGSQFEKGLARLKSAAESAAQAQKEPA